MEVDSLNHTYQNLSARERVEKLFEDFDSDKILYTSSFGSTSVALLHLINSVRPEIKVHFLDTGYHFQETLDFKNDLIERLKLNVIDLRASTDQHQYTSDNKIWTYNQDLCCDINKVRPLDRIRKNFDVWITGLMRFQNHSRQSLDVFEDKKDILKFYPIIDWKPQDLGLYLNIYELPIHPLVNRGYDSIGCHHCTVKGNGRSGRWMNSNKIECGLHV